MTHWHLAQLNIAQLQEPLDSPALADFVANLDRINALAEASPGFVWRFTDEALDLKASSNPFGDDMIVNMSVWTSIETLHDYVYQSGHIEIMRLRKKWFKTVKSRTAVLWWVPKGHLPDLLEAQAKLHLLNQSGPTQHAFMFKSRMPPPVP